MAYRIAVFSPNVVGLSEKQAMMSTEQCLYRIGMMTLSLRRQPV